jgi:kynurenine formamidase
MITTAELESLLGKKVRKDDILIVRTGWNSHYTAPDFFTDSPHFEPEAADWCVEKGIKMVVIDCLADAHGKEQKAKGPGFKERLLSHGILNMTNADNLHAITKDLVTVYAFPIKVIPSEAGLTRAVVWEE